MKLDTLGMETMGGGAEKELNSRSDKGRRRREWIGSQACTKSCS